MYYTYREMCKMQTLLQHRRDKHIVFLGESLMGRFGADRSVFQRRADLRVGRKWNKWILYRVICRWEIDEISYVHVIISHIRASSRNT